LTHASLIGDCHSKNPHKTASAAPAAEVMIFFLDVALPFTYQKKTSVAELRAIGSILFRLRIFLKDF
jgi:hypothetical protein